VSVIVDAAEGLALAFAFFGGRLVERGSDGPFRDFGSQ
jgi:hypothetical protein